jgi:hypothetical protein
MSGNDVRYPTFHVFKLLKYFARGGDKTVRATSDNKLLSAYAAQRADKTLALLVINKSPQTITNVRFSIASFQPQPEATIYSYGIPQDEAARTGIDSEEIAESRFTGASAEFARPIPPYSVTVMVLSSIRANHQ